jgi:hypothetical protein
MPELASPLTAVTHRGRLVPAQRDGFLELDTSAERFELLGPFDNEAQPGDTVEITGVVAPRLNAEDEARALLVRHVRRL